MPEPQYDALLIVSFGGPEGPDDVLPFLENVLRGRNVPRERMLDVAEHYQHFGGVSPINQQCRELIAALEREFAEHELALPIYWGNRNWHPYLADTLREMAGDGICRSLAWVTSTFSSYSGCRQYHENLADALASVGSTAPRVDKLRNCFNHPGFIAAVRARVEEAMAEIPQQRKSASRLIFTAHSIPLAMARNCQYEAQLREAAGLVAEALRDQFDSWDLVYQSRSGPPQQPWLEPDICDHLRKLRGQGVTDVVVMPIGFVSDHIEVLFDLDTEARGVCEELDMNMVRARAVGTHPLFVSMIRDLVTERMQAREPGVLGVYASVSPRLSS